MGLDFQSCIAAKSKVGAGLGELLILAQGSCFDHTILCIIDVYLSNLMLIYCTQFHFGNLPDMHFGSTA